MKKKPISDREITVAIISDLHCRYIGPDNGPLRTYLTSDALRDPPEQHPVEALNKLIESTQLSVDYLLCPGDITDRMDKQGFIAGWNYLLELKRKFKARELLATVGNHDVDSRNILKLGGPFELPKKILQGYPVESRDNQSRFWSEHYHIRATSDAYILVINSSYSHVDEKSAGESKIEPSILSRIEGDLKQLKDSTKLRIAMCHHHPSQHANASIKYKDADVIDHGDKLLQLLSKYDFQILIHGHKHEPRLSYIHDMTVFASGSFSSHENVRELEAENVFHLVTFSLANKRGKVSSYVYSPHKGWYQKRGAYFPTFTGFGCREELENLAKTINDWFIVNADKSQYGRICSYEHLIKAVPNLGYLIPASQEKLTEILDKNYEIIPSSSLADMPQYFTKKEG